MHLKSDRWWDWKLSSVYINIRLFQGIPTSRNFELDPLLVNNCNALCTDPLDVGVIAFLRIRVSESINFLVSFFIFYFIFCDENAVSVLISMRSRLVQT